MLFKIIAVIAVVPLTSGFLEMGRKQSIAVAGRVICNGMPAPGVRVKLYDDEILFDRQMDEKYTTPFGTFLVAGTKREFTNIDPELYIYHRCNYNGPCVKKARIEVPNGFVTMGPVPMITANLGIINLNGPFDSHSVDCIN